MRELASMTSSGTRGFVILSTQRSGSNWLEDRLGAHPSVMIYPSEVFRSTLDSDHAYVRYRDQRAGRRVLGLVAPPITKSLYVRWLHTSAPVDAAVIGFRLMYDQLRRNPSLAVILRAYGMRVIHLVRENLLETTVSVQAARASGLYVTRSTVEKTPQVHVDAAGLLGDLERRERLIARHRRLLRATSSLELSYESYVADPASGDTLILGFLGLEAVELGSRIQRSGAQSVRDRISNVDEVEAALASTPFTHFLDQ